MDRYRSTLPLCVPPWPRQAIRTWSELHRNQDLDHTIFRSRIETVLDWAKASYRRILVTERVRRQRLELAI